MSNVRRGQWWVDGVGSFRVIVVAEGYAMCRRRGCAPFLRSVREFAKFTRVNPEKVHA